jgi:two-component system response regulator PilR (NtrC family)
MLGYPYPGNVRELGSIIEHAVTMADGETVHEAHLSPQVLQPPRGPMHAGAMPAAHGNGGEGASALHLPPVRPVSSVPAFFNGNGKAVVDLETHLEEYEKNILLRALDDAGGVKKRAAELLGINYRSFRHRLSKYGLNGEAHGEADA